MSRTTSCAALLASTLLLAACGGPLLPPTSEILYARAKQEIAKARYSPAVDTLARVMQEDPRGGVGGRARILRVALLGGMARGFQETGESYLAGAQAAGAAAHAGPMRRVALDYFSRARGRSLEMIEALDRLLQQPLVTPLQVDFVFPSAPESAQALLAPVRQGRSLEEAALRQAEHAVVLESLREVLGGFLAVTPEVGRGRLAMVPVEVDPATFYLGAARELIRVSQIFGPDALREPHSIRLYHERALALAERAEELAGKGSALAEEARRVREQCQKVLKG